MGRWENEEGKVGKARSCLPLIQGLLLATLRKYNITEIQFFLASIENKKRLKTCTN